MPAGDFTPRRFDFGRPAVVQQPFTCSGKEYGHGEEFPYEQLGLDRWTMRGYWLSCLVDFVDEPIAAPVDPPRKDKSGKWQRR